MIALTKIFVVIQITNSHMIRVMVIQVIYLIWTCHILKIIAFLLLQKLKKNSISYLTQNFLHFINQYVQYLQTHMPQFFMRGCGCFSKH
ncbi:MAG: hypothetical protein CMI02_16975 [Oceanospirillaceae bacterium]|nr:hypothetical protein [Oceanospirillaceae bacterium]